ncbi:MAG: hypothetical protein AAFR90_07060 [Pseudomonadota bacterium]
MKYTLIGALGVFALSFSAAFAANGADVSAEDAAGALADRFIELRAREAEIHSQPQEQSEKAAQTQDVRQIEWQKKLDTLSEKLKLARKNFKSASSETFDFALAPPFRQKQPAE